MTTHDTDTFNLPAPSDFELTVLDRRTRVRRSSDREVAHLDGKTVAEYETDTTEPDRHHVQPSERCCFNYFVKLRNVNGDRPDFFAYCQERGRAEGTLQLWQWDSLLAMFDARDEAHTQADVRAASYPY